jgi:hypothetical protein
MFSNQPVCRFARQNLTLLIEVHAYKDRNTKHFVQGTRHGEDVRRTCGVVATVVSARQAHQSYGSAGKKNVYHLVLADYSFDLFKAVLNSGLSELFEHDVPRVGASATIIESVAAQEGVA